MDNAHKHYCSDEEFIQYYGRVPLFRYDTLKYCWNHFIKNDFKTIAELGTSRSFVDGKYPGCNSNDVSFWELNNPTVWDWSAGCFTRLIGLSIQDYEDVQLLTVDLEQAHINRCKVMTEGLKNIEYYTMSSEEFLDSGEGQIDFLYMDTGDMTPIEPTAQLHLREAKLLVEKDLISPNGIVLIDDVRNTTPKRQGEQSDYGKAKYSIPYLIANGFELVMDEYQVVLIKK